MLDRHDLTDEEWARLEPLLPDQTPQRGDQWADHRTAINDCSAGPELRGDISPRLTTGAGGMLVGTNHPGVVIVKFKPAGDGCPPVYGHWKTVYSIAAGQETAPGREILDELRRAADLAQGAEWTVGSIAGTKL